MPAGDAQCRQRVNHTVYIGKELGNPVEQNAKLKSQHNYGSLLIFSFKGTSCNFAL